MGNGLATGFHNVVVITAMELADVEGEATVIDHGHKKFPHQLGVVTANAMGAQLRVKLQIGTTGAVQSHLHQGFIQRGQGNAPSGYAAAVPQGLPQAVPMSSWAIHQRLWLLLVTTSRLIISVILSFRTLQDHFSICRDQ